MPSRPVLIGRGLVPTTYKTTHAQNNEHMFASTRQFPDHNPAQRGNGCTRTEHVSPKAWNTPTPDQWVRVFRQSYGGHSERETPGPIPNPEVKPFSADGTATERLWESRTPPDIHWERGRHQAAPLSHFPTCPPPRAAGEAVAWALVVRTTRPAAPPHQHSESSPSRKDHRRGRGSS